MIKVIIAGPRDFNPPKGIFYPKLDKILQNYKEVTILSGKARGVDTFGEDYADSRGFHVEEYPANWDEYGKSAGPVRNKQMAENASALIVIRDRVSKGTNNMIELAKRYNLKIRVLNYET